MKYLVLILFLIPAGINAQSDVFTLTESAVSTLRNSKGWIRVDSGYRFNKGDDLRWALPEFNDENWKSTGRVFKLPELVTVKPYDIFWFRLRIRSDSSFLQPLIMRVGHSGASEIYLDGKLIHRFGVVSSNPDSAKFHNGIWENKSFPLKEGKTQVLAIRFVAMPAKFPLYLTQKFMLTAWVTPADNAQDDFILHYINVYRNKLNIAIGVSFLILVLYLSFFLFFPAQKVSLYFSLANLFFLLYLISDFIYIAYPGPEFPIQLFSIITGVLYLLLILYSVYRVFNRRLGRAFKVLLAVSILSVPACFLIPGSYALTALAVLSVLDALRIAVRSGKAHRNAGTMILIVSFALNVVYWLLSFVAMITLPSLLILDQYSPFAYLLAPVGLAIYLGYSYGVTSRSLLQKLSEVETLSKEKQEILSNQNVRLETLVTERTAELDKSLKDLKATQAQLIHSEKMASLGELTAGIAHEIQNPLNFVNNFSEVNNELIEELKSEWSMGNSENAEQALNDIYLNNEKINHHGKRADAIVKGMLQHSSSKAGTKELTDINALAEEYLRLSYHGIRAKDKSFNAILTTDYDNTIEKINIIPQDIGRALLNIINNAFYAVAEKSRSGTARFVPAVTMATRRTSLGIEVEISDNGNGIPDKIIGKIFQPFFTTKPTGQGTGLGLSLAYDIVKSHGGELKVDSRQKANGSEEQGTTFIIQLPINYA